MSNAVFPTLIGLRWDIMKSPMWHTKIQAAASGKETRLGYMSYPLWHFQLAYDILRSDTTNLELQNLMGFFNLRNGSFDTFLFTDPDDNAVVAQSFGVGDGATTAFQLVRSYGGFSEPIQNLNGAPLIYVDGTLKTVTTDYIVSSLGVVTFTSAPANGALLTWSGSFYYRCRFLQDQAEFSKFAYQLWELQQLEFQSVKL